MEDYTFWKEEAQEESDIQDGMYYRAMGIGKFIKECEDKGYKMLGIKFDESNNCEFFFISPEDKK